jgi:hypothetical protein
MGEIEDVAIENTATAAQLEAVEAAFRRHGLEVEVRPAYARRAADVLPWIVHITLAAPIAAFFVAFGTEAGKDAYGAVKEWAKDVYRTRRNSGTGQGSITLEDPDQTELVLHSSIPDDALDGLRELDWDQLRGGYLLWDEQRQEWRDYMKRG